MAEAAADKGSVLTGCPGVGKAPARATRDSAYREARAILESSGADSPAIDALALLSHAESRPVPDLLCEPGEPLCPEILLRYAGLVSRRALGEPLGRITGFKEFHSLRFEVLPGVFMPRFETEGLADLCIGRLSAIRESNRAPLMLDLCTGSGVLAVTAAFRVPGTTAAATDSSPGALESAARNAAAHGVAGRLAFREGDLYRALDRLGPAGPFDLIAANPPYVPTGEMHLLPAEVRLHDPASSLDGGPDGADVIRRVVEGAPGRLAPGGSLLVEIGEGQSEAALSAARTTGCFPGARVEPDLCGVPRYLVAERS